MTEFKELIQASMRPAAVVMILFIIGWLLVEGMTVPDWMVALTASVISFLFGERAASK